MPTSKVVRLANKATAEQLTSLISSEYELPSMKGRVQYLHAKSLDEGQRESIWSLFETNMYELYKDSSFGWDPPRKKKELFHSFSRFVLVYQADSMNLLAFTMFRFEFDEDEDIVYCYDLQVSKAHQGLRLGRKLLNELTKLGKAFHLEKVILTVLKTNVEAVAFYKAVGFVLDPTSPDHEGHIGEEEVAEVDYQILSRSVA
ncbi:acyl-CoA N-acyltransferase [Gymnopilus junonius]|uniref:N-alpha-acetyltransferase 40 n=1 Tax=Gymnopilus junonius TaxID=109634 RepID=A0A9P5NXB9_GYMJU|nr:acyl-CoA N-acyltransferase [Gymnopilus junonius]